MRSRDIDRLNLRLDRAIRALGESGAASQKEVSRIQVRAKRLLTKLWRKQ